ncbi:sugar transferase [uncultured Sphingomonas sp.]|uniref:sugar transferase n=1 Tax=uncultured Sphingomonas sp. TaxID=158754 RepID=UPI0035CA8109
MRDLGSFVGTTSAPAGPPLLASTDFSAERITRAIDIVIALAALAFFAPLMILVALTIILSGGPVLYRQRRVGRGGALFTCFKFRTMHTDADGILARVLEDDPVARAEWDRDRKLRNDPRIIKVGSVLRKTSLDELPQILNVLNGSMSIVGPRPIVQAESHRYGRYLATYCRVRPGITGLWQISGRNGTSYRRRIACDVTYVRSKSAMGDVRILFKTIPAVCLARGAY